MSSFEPEAFGKYFLVDKIATGGMAEIFKAKSFGHGGFENLVVIKRILSHLGENEDFVDMFIDEAKVSVALQHTNIVRVYDFGKVFDNYFIAMECVEGKDARNILRKMARKQSYLPLEFALLIAHQAAKGLSYAHTKHDLRGHPFGIVHRDMSPSNVLVGYDGTVKIADFGIAKAEQNTYTTADGVLKGKFEYMSPEQARGETVDARSDLFSLGIILYELVTGRRLFKGDSDVATLERIKAAEVQAPSSVATRNPRIPAEVDRVILKALARDREDRYQTAAQLQAALREVLPAPPDQLQVELATYLRDLFRAEIHDERERLEQGSRVATAWRETADDSMWDDHSTATIRVGAAAPPSRKRSAMLIGVAVALFLVVGSAAAFGTFIVLGANNNQPQVQAAPAAMLGQMQVRASPAADVYLNGVLHDSAKTMTVLESLEPGTYLVELKAAGREPFSAKVAVKPAERVEVNHTFPELVAEAPVVSDEVVSTPAAASSGDGPAAKAPRVQFRSTPSGATVLVDGRRVGTTPTTWKGRTGTHTVELKLNGYTSAKGTLANLQSGQSQTFERSLKKIVTAPGTVTVGIIGGGWGTVFVDGKEQSAPAPGRYEIAPGKHEIRVVNPDLGIDYTSSVTVTAGGKARVNASPSGG